jgi:hypothetical protein
MQKIDRAALAKSNVAGGCCKCSCSKPAPAPKVVAAPAKPLAHV